MVEPDGFRDFVAAHGRALQRTAWLLTGDWASAEDLVQTALAAVWPRWDRIGPLDEMRLAYIHRVMVTTWMRWRRRRWTGEIPTEQMPERPLLDDERAELRRDLLVVLSSLPARQRSAVVLRYFVDLSEADTATAMGCSVGAVKSHTHKAIARLRAMPQLADELTGDVP